MTGIVDDLRLAARALVRRPGFTFVACTTLALAIAAVTAVLALVDAVLLRPLPYERADRLVMVRAAGGRGGLSLPALADIRRDVPSFEAVSAFNAQSVNLTGLERPDRLRGGFVSADFFTALRVGVARGRAFVAADSAPGAAGVVVLSHAVWRDRLGADPAAVGRTLTLNGEPCTVIGVLGEDFSFPIDTAEIFLPDVRYPSADVTQRSATNFWALARLRDGVALETARAELAGLAKRLAHDFPKDHEGLAFLARDLQDVVASELRPSLLVLLAAVCMILLVACANVANLLLARGVHRAGEVAVRSALGASRSRLLVQLLAEPVVLAFAGAGIGVAAAGPLSRALVAATPNGLPGGMKVVIDGRVLGFAALAAVGAALLSGLLPAWRSARLGGMSRALRAARDGGRGTSAGVMVAQVALAVVLLVGAGLLVRSFWRLAHASPGFEPQQVISLEYRLPRGKYPAAEQQWAFHRRVVEQASALPGVTAAAVVSGLPLSGNGSSTTFALPGEPPAAKGKERTALLLTVTPSYFQTLEIPLVQGRVVADSDVANAPLVAVVNRTLAEALWPGGRAVGQRLALPDAKLEVTVVGVVGDARQYALAEPARPQIYGAFAQNPGIFATLVARASGDAGALGEALRSAVWAVDADQPVWKVRTLQHLVESSLAPSRVLMVLVGTVAVVALALTALGLFGVLSYLVGRRRREFGIRMALGASRRDVAGLVRRGALRMTLLGVALGGLGAFAASRLLATFLFGVTTYDGPTYLGAVAVVVGAALLASALPAWRAASVLPATALRDE